VLKENVALQEYMVQLVSRVLLVLRAPLVLRVQRVSKVKRVTLVKKDLQGRKVIRVLQEPLEKTV
jgi:hypothetical protein